MKSPLLILDVSFLAYRACYAMGGLLSYGGNSTDVVYGLLRDLVVWQEMFSTDRVCFCFDSGTNKRREMYPRYKIGRSELKTEEQGEVRRSVREQTLRLRDEELYRIGYRNIFWREGYEADDVIASVVLGVPEDEDAIVIASDHDLYQLISGNVRIYDPRTNKSKTLQWFKALHGILPHQWPDVKAIVGCPGDGVEGIRGVGTKGAVEFLLGAMKKDSAKYRKIAESKAIWERNLKLVKLPYEGIGSFSVREDKVTKERWKAFCDSLGMRTLAMASLSRRRQRRVRMKLRDYVANIEKDREKGTTHSLVCFDDLERWSKEIEEARCLALAFVERLESFADHVPVREALKSSEVEQAAFEDCLLWKEN